MANPARFALERPRVVLVATLLGVAYGALTYLDLPRQENPTLRDRFAAVWTYLPGAEPEKVELLVSKVVEDKIAEVDDIETLFSSSSEGASFLQVEVKKGAPYEERLQQIRDKVQEARALLPEGASEPEVDTRVLRTNTMILAVTGDGVDPLVLREHARELERALEAMPDVARAELLGEPREEIEVDVDPRELTVRGIPLVRIVETLAARNVLLPGGELEIAGVRSPVQTSGAYDAVEQIEDTFVVVEEGSLPIRIGDVAKVVRRLSDDEPRTRWNGLPAVSVALEMLPGRNAVRVGEKVRTLIREREPDLPDGIRVRVVADEPAYVEARLERLGGSLLLGLALVTGLTFLGLGWRSGLIVSLSIPVSLTVAMGLLGIVGVPLHQISIAALVIAIGLVVDEAIVIVDNIQRHLDLGSPPGEAAIRGLGEIHLAVLAGAATTVAAFVPLMLVEGDVGDFIRSIPVAVSLMLAASVTVAHFLTPLVTAWIHERIGSRRVASPEVHRFEPTYHRALGWVVSHAGRVLGLFAVGVVVSLVAIRTALWPPDFFTDADRNQFLFRVWLPTGSAIEESDAVMRTLEASLAEDPDVSDWMAYIGVGAPKFYYNEFSERRSENVGMVIVNLDPSMPFRETRTVASRLDRQLKAEIPGAFVHAKVLRQGYSGGSDIEIFVEGDRLAVLRSLAARVAEVAREVEGIANVWESFGYDPLTIQAEVDPASASLLGITHRDVATTLRIALDGIRATTFREEDEEIDVTVRVRRDQAQSLADLEVLPVHSPVHDRAVPLAQVASLVPGFTTSHVMRWKRKREASIQADVEGRSLLAVAFEVERRVRERVSLPAGYHISFWGQRRAATESFLALARAGIVAILLIYLILVVRFHSLSQPLLIVLAIPMALVGSTWGLVMTGSPFSFTAFLGVISLTGIVVNDSIILMDYINTLRERGVALEAAVVRGATTRLRAVTLTSVTTIGGILPLTLTGGEFFAPFGWAMIGGLTASTVLTLGVQPAAYLMLERRTGRRAHGGAAVPSADPGAPPTA